MGTLLLAIAFVAAQIIGSLSMTSTCDASGCRMNITGAASDIAAVCAQGDCTRVFSSALDATNYFLELWGNAKGLDVVPIPPPPPGG